jgi:hypothetical protein
MRRSLVLATTLFVAGAFTGTAFADRQPHMRDAVRHLEKAIASLEAATADKGGHRVKALEHAKKALDETQAGIKFDNKN